MAYIAQMDAGPDLLLTMNKCSLPPCPSPPASPPAPISGLGGAHNVRHPVPDAPPRPCDKVHRLQQEVRLL